jgi:hypothetical protein
MEILKKVWCSCLLSSWVFTSLVMTSVGEDLSHSHPVPDFAVGQEWSIESSSRSTAKIVIGRIEPWRDKIAVHVAIVDIPNSQAGTGASEMTQIAHIPFERSALAGSVGDLIATHVTPPPDFEVGYRQWKERRGGVFTVSVAQAIGLGQKILQDK